MGTQAAHRPPPVVEPQHLQTGAHAVIATCAMVRKSDPTHLINYEVSTTKTATISLNLCNLPPAEKALIEVDKAAAYAVWKERNGHLATAELDSSPFKGHELEVFTKALAKYRTR